ncbi:MAG: efflux RND transporter permease subunit [Bacteroidales bacterium]|nr:efflux RND transporter permease subunit [Bacteroidales bacterium]MCF8398925.1 efflux RND transporter permease subunit [Bacteroidales bacterium]
MNLIRSSLKYKQVSLIIILMVFVIGIYSLMTMPRRSSPEITVRQALIVAFYPGATASQVQEQVTKNIEEKLFTYKEVDKSETYSTTTDGLLTITVSLEDWVELPDLFWERLGQGLFQLKETSLPQGVIGPIVDSDFGDVVSQLIALETKEHSYSELKDYVEIIENNLRQLKEVSKISHLGYQAEEIHVLFDSEKLARYDVSLLQIIEALKTQNSIKYAGYLDTEQMRVKIHASGLYSQLESVKNQMVGTSPEGAVIRIKDIAKVKRKLQDISQLIRINGNESKVMLISLQMQSGYNIVEFGTKVNQILEDSKQQIPDEVNMVIINDQPAVVKSAVNDFMREFIIAVVAVIIVIMLLLPFRVALIAAFSIPVSIGMTFTFLNLFGYELQQVSLASLIVVLGMVVDNAVVVIDNYIDKLDSGMKRFDAAWKSATEFSISLFSSTLSIIVAFLPLVFMLSGATGQFLITLPVTVAISMSCSLVVAFFMTPFLAYVFIRKGLKKDDAKAKKKFNVLDAIQYIFNRAIDRAMNHKAITVILGVLLVVGGALMFSIPKQQFFPDAQRNQFIIQVFEPMGTRYHVTKSDVQKIEDILVKDSNITAFASFIGTSAPRVYYSFAPVFPQESYAQILVNTSSTEITEELAPYYLEKLQHFLPNAHVDVMQFAQGVPTVSPVEVRVYGNNIDRLNNIGDTIKEIFRKTEGSRLIRQDFDENFILELNIDEEVSNRLGFTTSTIAEMLGAGLHGAPVSRLWEGDDPLNIVFKLEKEKRDDYSDVLNTYISNPFFPKFIPIRQFADATPRWQVGKITRRNGIPALTTGCKPENGYLASEVLQEAKPAIDKLTLPPGYRLEYGGDYKNQGETFGHMIAALIISLVSIFIILLVQFRDVARPLIIMVSIPLTLFGAILGLIITGNVFSFTAFVGLIALVGIVIRNALIIVDFSDSLVKKENISFAEAARESAKRRLRPIFLTTMAAAIGVVPMIVLKDPLWAPLASVFAFGIVISMILTLMVIPALYAIIIRKRNTIGD